MPSMEEMLVLSRFGIVQTFEFSHICRPLSLFYVVAIGLSSESREWTKISEKSRRLGEIFPRFEHHISKVINTLLT